MGACASLPKGMRGAAPAPEPLPKEKSVQAYQHNAEEVIKVEKEENKANGVAENRQQALGSLLNDQHQPEKTEGKKEANDQSQQPQVEIPAESKKEAKPELKVEEAQAEAKKEEAEVEPKKEEAKPEQAPAAPMEIKE